MPGSRHDFFGVKLVTVQKSPAQGTALIHGIYALFSASTLEPVLLMDAPALTSMRTGAVSAIATKYLAASNAHRLVIFGAGVQAHAHLKYVMAVRKIQWLRVISRREEPALALVRVARQHGIDAELGDIPDVAGADLICTCTTSNVPLFACSLLKPNTHINAVGTHHPEHRELDSDTMRRATVFVETRDAALKEAGELAIPIAQGVFDPSHIVADLSEVVRENTRRTYTNITVFKSVGVADEDLAVATEAYRSLVSGCDRSRG